MINYFAENLWQMWALVSVVCLILELRTVVLRRSCRIRRSISAQHLLHKTCRP